MARQVIRWVEPIYKLDLTPKEKKRLRKRKKLQAKAQKEAIFLLKKSKSVRKFAKKLKVNIPKSEQWFHELWEPFRSQHKFTQYHDLYNEPIGIYIPDVVNRGYKYIIEIDGSIHDRLDIKAKDLKKTQYYEKQGFLVLRIKAYNLTQFKEVKDKILKRRLEKETNISTGAPISDEMSLTKGTT